MMQRKYQAKGLLSTQNVWNSSVQNLFFNTFFLGTHLTQQPSWTSDGDYDCD